MTTEDFRLAAHEAAVVGEAAGTPLRELSAAALRVLVAHYIDESEEAYYLAKYDGWFDWKRAAGGGARFRTLAVLMGEEAYFALDAEKDAWWRQRYAEADAEVRALTPCVTCGRARSSLADKVGDLCRGCHNEKWKREHPGDGKIGFLGY
jgi:hypothetical protein